MQLEIVLPLRNQPELEKFLQELYDPSSPEYRNFLTVEEFTARFGPNQEDYDAVIQFAKANGLRVVGKSANRMNVSVTGTVGNIESAFHVTIGVYPVSYTHLGRKRRQRTDGLHQALLQCRLADPLPVSHDDQHRCRR